MYNWQRSFYALWVSQWLVMIGFGVAIPFYPLFIQDLGISDLGAIEWWSGIAFAVGGFGLTLSSPIWGAVADRYGRKLMVVRAIFGGTAVLAAIGFSRNVYEFVALRTMSGLLTGTMGATAALTSTMSSKERLSSNLGLMQTAAFAGSSMGPLLGGFVAAHLGNRAVFFFGSGLLLAGGLLVVLLVRETFTPTWKGVSRKDSGFFHALWVVGKSPPLLAVNTVLLIVQGAMFGMAPTVTLFVQDMSESGADVATAVGIIFGATALSSAVASVWVGRHTDRWGYRRVLFVCTLGAGLLSFPQAWVSSWIAFLVLRVMQGAFVGGIVPVSNAVIARLTRSEHRGSAFGVAGSAMSLGSAIAPLALAAVASSFGLGSAFTFVGTVVLVVAVWIAFVNLGEGRAATPSPAG